MEAKVEEAKEEGEEKVICKLYGLKNERDSGA